jgi:hypothetical protein
LLEKLNEMSKILSISRFLSAYIALLCCASPVLAQDYSIQSRATHILSSSSVNGFKTSVGNFSGAKINPSSIKITVGNADVTSMTDITVSRGATYGEIYDGFNFDVKLTDPIKAQPNLEIKLSGTTKDGILFETKTVAGIVAKIAVAPINFIEISPNFFDDTLPLDPFALEATPTVVFAQGQINIMYKAGDDLSNLDVNVPVVALSENGDIVPTNSSSVKLNDQRWTNGSYSLSAPMINGVAVVPLKLKVPIPGSFSLDIDTILLDQQASSLGISSRVQTRNPLVIVAIPVVVVGLATYVIVYHAIEIIKEVMQATNPGYVDSNMSGNADELLMNQQAIPRVFPNTTVTTPGICPITTTANPVIRRTRNRPLTAIATPAQCLPTPDQSAGPSNVPSQERFNENEAKPSDLDYAAQQGIWDKMLQEADLFCRFGKGTSSKFTKPEIDILKEAGRMWKGGTKNGESRTKVLDFLKSKGLIGEKGKYTGHHQNSKACYPSLARDIKNLTIVESKQSVHRDICHSGKYGNCTFGELFKETTDIISEFINVQGLKNDELGVCR